MLVALLLPVLLSACSTLTSAEREARRLVVKVTPDDDINPRTIRFDLYRTPYVDEQDQRLPVHEQIRLGMRRFAAEQLMLRGWCKNGFEGPKRVYVPEDDIQHSFFHVECLQPELRNK